MPRQRRIKYDENGNEIVPKVRPSKKLKDDEKSLIRRNIQQISNVRHRAYPFPFDTSQEGLVLLVESTLEPDYLHHLHALWNNPTYKNILNTTRSTTIAVDNTILKVTLPADAPFRNYGSSRIVNGKYPQMVDFNNPSYPKLSEWAGNVADLKHKSIMVKNIIDNLMDKITTSGQLIRAWPELINYLPESIAHNLHGAVRASRLPPTIDLMELNDKRDEATEFLAFMTLIKNGPNRDVRVWIE